MQTNNKYEGEISPIEEWEAIKRNALDAIAMNPRLQAYAQFEIFIKSNQSMSDDEITELIGFKPPRTGYSYDCYQFTRFGSIHVLRAEKLLKQSTWKLEKVNLQKQNFLRAERKRQRKLQHSAAEEERAIGVYNDFKEVMTIE
jgi:hypothetical protein